MRKLIPVALFVCSFVQALSAPLRSDETVIFFPSFGWKDSSGDTWNLDVRGWVFEQEKRPGATEFFLKYLGWDKAALTDVEKRIFAERANLFLVDAEGGKNVSVSYGQRTYDLPKSERTGFLSSTIQMSASDVEGQQLRRDGVILVLEPQNNPTITNSVRISLLSHEGLSVVSDIDDTIKISDVRDRQKLLRNTFLNPFSPVPGMAGLYRSWATNEDVAFHYVSGSPLQLFLPLYNFVGTNGFPEGSFHLRTFDWRSELSFASHSSIQNFKVNAIVPILESFPKRHFIFVGDSGEKDPEIYGEVARKYPSQVERIFIRDVTGDSGHRYGKAFRNVPATKWKVFKEPSELE